MPKTTAKLSAATRCALQGVAAMFGFFTAADARAQPKGFFVDIVNRIDMSGILPGSNRDPEAALGGLISGLLAFLGVIFMALIIYGGFLWMTARGAEDQIGKAKKIITSATIGLAVVLTAYLISLIVVALLTTQTQTP